MRDIWSRTTSGLLIPMGDPRGIFAVATKPSGALLNEAMYTTKQPLLAAADEPRFSAKGEKPVRGAKSDHEMKFYSTTRAVVRFLRRD